MVVTFRRANLAKADNAKLNPLVMLVIWSVWRERNASVFDKKFNPMNVLIQQIKTEAKQWSFSSKGAIAYSFVQV
jgi:hypothetical protein